MPFHCLGVISVEGSKSASEHQLMVDCDVGGADAAAAGMTQIHGSKLCRLCSSILKGWKINRNVLESSFISYPHV